MLAVGVEIGVDEKKLLVAHLLGRDGTFTFLDLHTGAILKQATTRRRESHRAEAASPSPSMRPSSTAGRYSLVWSDGTMSLVEAAVAADPKRRPWQARLHGSHPGHDSAGKGPAAAPRHRAGLEGQRRHRHLRRMLPNNRIRVIRQVREENLAGRVTMKTKRHGAAQ